MDGPQYHEMMTWFADPTSLDAIRQKDQVRRLLLAFPGQIPSSKRGQNRLSVAALVIPLRPYHSLDYARKRLVTQAKNK